MTVASFVDRIKRRCKTGRIGSNSDQTTADIIDSLNDRRFEMWRFYRWWFGIIEDDVVQPANDPNLILNVNIGDILAIDAGSADYLREMQLKDYLRFRKQADVSDPNNLGPVTRYVKLGRDDQTGAFKIRLVRTPSANLNLTIYGKKRLADFTVGDIALGTLIDFFPAEAHPILTHGVKSDIYEILGKTQQSETEDDKFHGKMRIFSQEQGLQADEDPTTPPPAYSRIARRKRGGRSVA